MPGSEEPHLNILHVTLRDHGYERGELTDEGWALYWHSGLLKEKGLALLARLAPYQRINKLPGASALTIKTNLWLCFEAMRRRHGAAHFDFVP